MDEQQWEERKAERDRCLKLGAFVPTPSQDVETLLENGAMISPAFLVSKKGVTNRWRMVINMKPLNKQCRRRRAKFQGLKHLRHVGHPGMWVFTWDLQNGYMNLGVFKPHRKYMTVDMGSCMARDGEPISKDNPRFVECAAMPFGFQNSPFFFVKMMKNIQKELALLGITCLMWLDDGIVLCDTREMCLEQREQLESVLKRFGLLRAVTKGEWDPSQDVVHLGMGVQTATGLFYVTKERRKKLAAMGKAILCSAKRHRRFVGCRWLAEFAGLAMSTHEAVTQCAFRLREIFDCLRDAEVWKYGYGGNVRLTAAALANLQWWVDKMRIVAPAVQRPNHAPTAPEPCADSARTTWRQAGVKSKPASQTMPVSLEPVELPLEQLPELINEPAADFGPTRPIWYPPVTAVVSSDASGEGAAEAPGGGWGATLGAQPLHAAPPGEDNGTFCRGIWAVEDRELHITAKELKAVRYALEYWRVALRGKRVLFWEDNQAVCGILRRLVTRSVAMRADLLAIIDLLEEENIMLQVRYIRSKWNPSDFYSRVRDKSEWKLSDVWAARLVHYFGPAQVDRFADSVLTLLPRFDASYPCRGAEAVDTFTRSWAFTHSWINPPYHEIGRILHKLWQEPEASATLLLPVWPSQPWWPRLLELAAECVPVDLPSEAFVPGPLMLDQPGMCPEPMMNSGWRLQLVLVPARTATESRFSASMTTGAVRVG